MRPRHSGVVGIEVTENPFVWGSPALCTGLLLTLVRQPGLADALKLEAPGAEGWVLEVVTGAIPLLAGPFLRQAPATRNGP